MEIRILICGDRHWSDELAIKRVMELLKSNFGNFTLIEGEALGADKLAASIAKVDLNLPVMPFPAEWGLWGKAAGPRRNAKMLQEGKPHGVVAFHNDLSTSRGTKNMVEQAMKAGLPVWVSTESSDRLGAFILEVKGINLGG